MVLAVAPSHFQVEGARQRIAKLGRKGSCIEIGVGELVVIQYANGSSSGTVGSKVVGVGNTYPIKPPHQANGRISPNNDIISLIARRHYPRIVGNHAGGVAPATCKFI